MSALQSSSQVNSSQYSIDLVQQSSTEVKDKQLPNMKLLVRCKQNHKRQVSKTQICGEIAISGVHKLQ